MMHLPVLRHRSKCLTILVRPNKYVRESGRVLTRETPMVVGRAYFGDSVSQITRDTFMDVQLLWGIQWDVLREIPIDATAVLEFITTMWDRSITTMRCDAHERLGYR